MLQTDRIRRVLSSGEVLRRARSAANKSPLRRVSQAIAWGMNWDAARGRMRATKSLALREDCLQLSKELQHTGYVDVQRVLSPALLEELATASRERTARLQEIRGVQLQENKKFWVRMLDEDLAKGNLSKENIFVKIALSPKLIQVVASRMGMVPRLSYVFLSLSQPDSESWSSSQLWHMDRDDIQVIKFFVYLNDVGTEQGPFTFLPIGSSRKVKNSFVMRHLKDEEVFKHIKRSALKEVTGPRLTSFLVDTGQCYHMGSRIQSGERLMYTAAYVSSPSIYGKPHSGIRLTGSETPLESLLLEGAIR